MDIEHQPIKNIFEKTNQFLLQVLNENNESRIAIHCQAGMSRSVTIAIAFLIDHYRLTLKTALCLIKEKRSIAKPNNGFMRQLISYEKQILGKNS